ncbi:uncharacterized protein LOC144357192, partial [Saccoglossus kowalevskii]
MEVYKQNSTINIRGESINNADDQQRRPKDPAKKTRTEGDVSDVRRRAQTVVEPTTLTSSGSGHNTGNQKTMKTDSTVNRCSNRKKMSPSTVFVRGLYSNKSAVYLGPRLKN